MKAQPVSQGITRISSQGPEHIEPYYRVNCNCGHPTHYVDFTMDVDPDTGDHTLLLYADMTVDHRQVDNLWKRIVTGFKIMFGYPVEIYADVSMTPQTALTFAKTVEKEVKSQK